MWEISDGELTNSKFPELPPSPTAWGIPDGMWRVDYERLTTELLPDLKIWARLLTRKSCAELRYRKA